jgi:hypothetical protein
MATPAAGPHDQPLSVYSFFFNPTSIEGSKWKKAGCTILSALTAIGTFGMAHAFAAVGLKQGWFEKKVRVIKPDELGVSAVKEMRDKMGKKDLSGKVIMYVDGDGDIGLENKYTNMFLDIGSDIGRFFKRLFVQRDYDIEDMYNTIMSKMPDINNQTEEQKEIMAIFCDIIAKRPTESLSKINQVKNSNKVDSVQKGKLEVAYSDALKACFGHMLSPPPRF